MKNWQDDWGIRRSYEQASIKIENIITEYLGDDIDEDINMTLLMSDIDSVLIEHIDHIVDTTEDITIDETHQFDDLSEEEIINILLKEPYKIKYVYNPTEKMQDAAKFHKL